MPCQIKRAFSHLSTIQQQYHLTGLSPWTLVCAPWTLACAVPPPFPWWFRWLAVCLQCRRVQCLAQEDPLQKEMAAHSSIPAWRIPWTEEPGGLQSMGSQRVRHDWATNTLPSSSRGGTEEKKEPSTRHRRYMEEHIDSPEGEGHPHGGAHRLSRGQGTLSQRRWRTLSQGQGDCLHGFSNTQPGKDHEWGKLLHKGPPPLPYCKSPTQWCKVSGWDTLDRHQSKSRQLATLAETYKQDPIFGGLTNIKCHEKRMTSKLKGD